MSLSNWKRLAQKRTETGRMKNQLYDEITEAKIKSKTSDQRITKSFRLDEIIEGLKTQKPKNRPQIRIRPAPAQGKPDEIDYAPEVDPYEDMDVEGLLDLQDYVAPQAEKQIAKMPEGPPPKYEMEPSFWNLEGDESLPPEYSAIEEEPSAIEAPREEFEGEEDEREANKILDHLELPNYDDVELRLAQPEMTATKQRNYLDKVIKDAERRRRQEIAFKANATRKFKKGEIDAAERDRIHQNSDRFRGELNDYIKQYRFKSKSTKGYGTKRGRGVSTGRGISGSGVYFYNDAKELLKKLTLIIGEMEAGNTSVKMRNMGQTILDTLLRTKSINKSQYQKLVKKYFGV